MGDSAVQRKAELWDASFADWHPGAGDKLLRAYSDAVNRRLLERWLPPTCHHLLKTDLFDEVAGTGIVGFLLGRAERVSGIDIAPSVVEAACAAHPLLEGTIADVQALPFPDEMFDVIVSMSTLDHFDSTDAIAQALGELHRVLRPGGSLIVTLDNASSPFVALRNALPYALLHRVKLVPYPNGVTCSLGELSRLVTETGLDVDEVDVVMHVPRLLVRAAGRSLAGDATRNVRWASRLLSLEPPRGIPLRTASGQFNAVRATRPMAGIDDRQPDPPWHIERDSAFAGGPRAVTMRILGRTIYRRLIWMERTNDPLSPQIEAFVPTEFGFLGEPDIEEILALRPGTGEQTRARFSRGDRCLGARSADGLVSLVWYSTGVAHVDYLALILPLRPNLAYSYDLWTDPRVRGLHIAPALGSRLRHVLAAEGIDTSACAALRENRPAITTLLRVGYRPVGTIGRIGAGKVVRTFQRRRWTL